jgi:hypothetical protein
MFVSTATTTNTSGNTGQLLPDLQFEEISLLPLDHPGAHDPAYRARRDYIASLAREYRQDPQHVIPVVEYTQEERKVWQYVCRQPARSISKPNAHWASVICKSRNCVT